MEGDNPVKKMRETSENLPKPSKKLSPGPNNQNLRENFFQNGTFFEQLLVLQHHNPQAATLTVAR